MKVHLILRLLESIRGFSPPVIVEVASEDPRGDDGDWETWEAQTNHYGQRHNKRRTEYKA